MGQAFKPIALVVEDDPDQRELLTVLLEESELHVFGCESAEAALRILD
jgi:DNA-binding response OmpR family regulator